MHAVALDSKWILPVSSLVNGPYGIRDVCTSIPTVVGRKGVENQLEIELWPKEISALATFGPGSARNHRSGLQEQPQSRRQGQAGRLLRPPRESHDQRNPIASRAGDDGSRRRQRRLRAALASPSRDREGADIMEKSLDRKLAAIHANPSCREFIIADAKDADMALGLGAPGARPRCMPAKSASRRSRSIAIR